MNSILIKSVMLYDTGETADILIDSGKIHSICERINVTADKTVDGEGLCAMPSLFDMHVHFRDPGFTYKEDIFSGAAAALAGGFTGVACMPNTKPPIDNAQVLEYIAGKALSADLEIYPVGCITKGMEGKELCAFSELHHAGAIALSDDGKPVESAELMKKALIKAASLQMPVISHCEDLRIIDGGIINKGRISDALGVKGMDRLSEDSITQRETELAEETGTRIHIAHVSTRGSVDIIRKAKARGVNVTCETCPHYFCLTETELFSRDADYRMNPPLREEADRLAVKEALADGTIDCIVTDHAPHSAVDKHDFLTAPNGIVGLETSLAATLTELYRKDGMSLSDIVRLMAENPRRILGLPVCTLKSGEPANLILVNLNETWTVEPRLLHSKSKNTAFKGRKLTGRPVMTIYNGEIRFEAGKNRAESR